MISLKDIQRLSKLGGKEFYITSLYLAVDRHQSGDYKIILKDLLKDRRQKLSDYRKQNRLTRDQANSIEKDFEKLETYILHDHVHKDNSKGLVAFSSSANHFWETFELPQPVPNYLNADLDPYVRPLSEMICDHRSYGILLVDSAKAKLLEVHLGFVREHVDIRDTVDSKIKYGGIDGTQEKKLDHAHQEQVHKHFKKVAAETKKMADQSDWMWLVIGGRQNMIQQFEAFLHSSIRKSVVGHIMVEPDAALSDILQKAEDVTRKAEQKYENDLIERLRNEAHGNGGRGIFGLQPTLQHLRRGGVSTLVVSNGYAAPGFVCHKCFFIGVPEEKGSQNTCPICSGQAHDVHDVVDEAITFALMQGCKVENTKEHPRLKIMGNIGALLRF